jgi:hypothetical protein
MVQRHGGRVYGGQRGGACEPVQGGGRGGTCEPEQSGWRGGGMRTMRAPLTRIASKFSMTTATNIG